MSGVILGGWIVMRAKEQALFKAKESIQPKGESFNLGEVDDEVEPPLKMGDVTRERNKRFQEVMGREA